ncbi:MAG: nucleotidyltransferase family protein [Rhodospirillales bacterium]|nr:nucleotidyltransferase family protein [Rhodospirillales bacterium]
MDSCRQKVADLIAADPARMRVLAIVADLALPDCWIGGGFVRSPMWDRLSGRPPKFPDGDIDVLWFDPARTEAAFDEALEARLAAIDPTLEWSVKNQARMHLRNGNPPYASTADAMRHWVETATAVAVRLADGRVEVSAPLGFDDLHSMTVRPTPEFAGARIGEAASRLRAKRWLDRWPGLRVSEELRRAGI